VLPLDAASFDAPFLGAPFPLEELSVFSSMAAGVWLDFFKVGLKVIS
jgi:hypothetical protein